MDAYSSEYSAAVNNKVLLGNELIIKIINPISGQTVAILKKSIIPCTGGCEFKYKVQDFGRESTQNKSKKS